jgi:hypothetical protein
MPFLPERRKPSSSNPTAAARIPRGFSVDAKRLAYWLDELC